MYRQDFGLAQHRAPYRKALQSLKERKGLHPRERLLLSGYSNLFLENYEVAARILKKARSAWPDSFWARFLYANNYP